MTTDSGMPDPTVMGAVVADAQAIADSTVVGATETREAITQDVALFVSRALHMLIDNEVVTVDEAIDAYRMGAERAFKYHRALAEKRKTSDAAKR